MINNKTALIQLVSNGRSKSLLHNYVSPSVEEKPESGTFSNLTIQFNELQKNNFTKNGKSSIRVSVPFTMEG